MFLVIGKKFINLKRGGHVVTKRLCSMFPDYLEYRETTQAVNLEELNEQYDRLIFRTQVPTCYATPVNIVRLLRLNHIIYIRRRHNFPTYNSCTNGFYYYKNNPDIKFYIPLITDFPTTKTPTRECLGFYSREYLTPDAYKWFVNKLDELSGIDVCILGSKSKEIEQKTKGRFKHTYDNIEFFNMVTHYVMPKSKAYIDPFPYTLLEAVQTGKQIILPTIHGRSHKDGIDDIQDFIKWHQKVDFNINYNNSGCPLVAKNFQQFYLDVFKNNFEYSFDRDMYKTMPDWVENEVL